MTLFGRALRVSPLLFSLFLTACGGGGSNPAPVQSAPGVQIGEPTPAALATAGFVARARLEACSDIRNKLYVIDNRMVLWDRAGSCPDNGQAQVLFGANAETMLCTSSSTIAGVVASCKDGADRTLFDTLRANLDRPGLGVAASHSVSEVSFLPANGAAVAFQIVASTGTSAITAPRTMLVRDAAALALLWKEHTANLDPAPPMPQVDFSTSMLVGVFAGTSSGCHAINLTRIAVDSDKLLAQYEEHDAGPGVVCIAAQTSPMQLAVLKRYDAELVFSKAAPGGN